MNCDTAPIAEVEDWLAPRLGWTKYGDKWSCDGGGEYNRPMIGHTMEDAIACLPPGWDWSCTAHNWYAVNLHNPQQHVELVRINSPRDELVRLAAKAWMAQEENNEK